MGDIADWCIDQMFDPEFEQDDDDPDAFQRDDCIWFPKAKTCQNCGKGGLHWEQVAGNYKLCDSAGIHMCKPAIDISVNLEDLL